VLYNLLGFNIIWLLLPILIWRYPWIDSTRRTMSLYLEAITVSIDGIIYDAIIDLNDREGRNLQLLYLFNSGTSGLFVDITFPTNYGRVFCIRRSDQESTRQFNVLGRGIDGVHISILFPSPSLIWYNSLLTIYDINIETGVWSL